MPLRSNMNVITKEEVRVEELLRSLVQLEVLNGGDSLANKITDKNLHRPGLALAGFVDLFTYHRVQIFGNTEMYYLQTLRPEEGLDAFRKIARFDIPCIILTNNHSLSQDQMDVARERNIAVFRTYQETTKTIALLSDFLDDQFAEQAVLHGSFVDVYGVGILLMGRSGIGKSEIALDLVERGHRLVADDVVMFTKKRENVLMGTGTSLARHFMEIRGLGIIDVERMFGIRAIRFQKRLEILVELEEWDKEATYTRTGLDEEPTSLLGVNVANVKLPIFPGKNVTVITEVIALNYLLKTYGYHAPTVFSNNLMSEMNRNREQGSQPLDKRLVTYFQSDLE